MPLLRPSDPAPSKPVCSIIIPVYNCYGYTRACLDALYNLSVETPFEIIVVDNHSTDGIQEWLPEQTGQIRLICSDTNLGFAKANNLAVKNARGEYLLFLNNDTIPEDGFLDVMMSLFASEEHIGAVGAKLLFPETRLVQHCGVVFEEPLAVSHAFGEFPEDHPAVNHRRDFQVVTAACMLVRKEIFQQLGGFDEAYLNGYEDIDFCLKVKEAGLRVVYEPGAVVLHHAERSIGRHDHDADNARLLFQRWGSKIVPDAAAIYATEGYGFISDGSGSSIMPQGIDLALELNRARGYLQTGRLLQAEQAYRRLYYQFPHAAEIITHFGQVLEKLGEWEQAEIIWKRLHYFRPGISSTLRVAHNAIKRGDFPHAFRKADEVIRSLPTTDPRSAEALAIAGDAWFKQGDMATARGYYGEAISVDPKAVRALVGLGAVALVGAQWGEGRRYFSVAAEVAPNNARARLGLAISLEGLGDEAAVAGAYEVAVQTDLDNSMALQAAAGALLKAGHLETLDRMLASHFDRFPDDPDVLALLTDRAVSRRDKETAEALLSNLRAFAPDHGRIPHLLNAVREMSTVNN